MRVLKSFIFTFSRRLLQEAGVTDEQIDDDLESLIYESGEKFWGENDDYYFIDDDDY